MSTEATEAVKTAVENVRPLSATQTKNLKEIVAGDFNKLRSQINVAASEMVAAKTKEIQNSANTAAQERMRAKAQKIVDKYNDQVRALSAEAKEIGLQITGIALVNPVGIKDIGTEQKIHEAVKEIVAEKDIALAVTTQKQLESDRTILLASITGNAEKVLDSLPSPQALMLEAAQQRADGARMVYGELVTS